MHKLYLIDASGYIYRNYFAIRTMTNSKGESTNALYGFIRSLIRMIKDFHPAHLVAVFDGPRNAAKRLALYPEYKANRLAMPLDLRHQIDWARDFCQLIGIPFLNIPEVEADDVMGSIAVWAAEQKSLVYLCTSDKDMCQLVNSQVYILNTSKDNQIIDEKEVQKIHGVPPAKIVDYLAMVGDSSDNVPGLPGFGPKTAAELLMNFGSLDYLLAHPQEVPGLKKQEILVQFKERALMSRQLVSLDLKVDFPQDVHFFKLKDPDKEKLREFYLSMNFNSLIKELESFSFTTVQAENGTDRRIQEGMQENKAVLETLTDYRLVDSEELVREMIRELRQSAKIGCAFHATPDHFLQAKILGISFCSKPGKAWYIPFNYHLEEQKVLKEIKALFEDINLTFYMHDSKIAYHLLTNAGIKLNPVCFDTVLASYILSSHHRRHSLIALSLEHFGKIKKEMQDLIGKGKNQLKLADVPIEKLKEFYCEEVDLICQLAKKLAQQVEERKLAKLFYELELPLTAVLANMERKGIYVYKNHLIAMSQEIQQEIQTLVQQIHAFAGEEFNINSSLQLKKILFNKLHIPYPKPRSKEISTGEEILELLMAEYPIAGKILEYRKLEKLRSTYADALPQVIDLQTNRIHCTFNQSVTATGRLSCQDPNLQNIPVRTAIGRKIREAFQPEKENWSYLAADYSQIELRILAHLSEDPILVSAFQNNEDIHLLTAAAIYNVPLTAVTKDQRYAAKAVNFGIIYGQQSYGLAKEIGISVEEAAYFIETYFKRFKKVKEYLETCIEEARRTGKAVTQTGRERLIPELHNKNSSLRSQAERLALNTPFQGTAADLIKIAMLHIDQALKEQGKLGYMVLQVHDELIFEVPNFELIDFKFIVKEAMEQVFKLKVPLVVDIAIGKNWKEC